MISLVIQKIIIKGFKKYNETVEFNFKNALLIEILGDNANGKTSIAESIIWCFTGCDFWGKAKAINNLKNEKSSTTSVQINFTFNNEQHSLIRTHANSNSVFLDGNKVGNDDVVTKFLGMSKEAFFLMVNPSYFFSLQSIEQKKILLKELSPLINISDKEIFEDLSDYEQNLLKKHNFKNNELFLKQKKQELSELENDITYCQGVLDNINANIKEVNSEDVALLNKISDDINLINLKIKEINNTPLPSTLIDLTSDYDKRQQLEQEIAIVSNKTYNAESISQLDMQINNLYKQLDFIPIEKPSYSDTTILINRKNSLAAKYKSVKEKLLTITDLNVTCPQCGHSFILINTAKNILNDELESIKKEGIYLKNEIEKATNNNSQLKLQYETNVKNYKDNIQQQINALNSQKQNEINMQQQKLKTFEVEKQQKIKHLKEMIENLKISEKENSNKILLTEFNKRKNASLDKLNKDLMEKINEKNNIMEIENIIKNNKNLQSQKEKILRKLKENAVYMEDLKLVISYVKKFNHAKLSKIKTALSSHLKKVDIDLFKINNSTGEIKECFNVLYEKRHYNILSNAEKIKTGLEISNLIKTVYNICVPIVIDNAESITRMEQQPNQVIKLKVVESTNDVVTVKIA